MAGLGVKEIRSLMHDLEKASISDKVLEILKVLKSELHPTEKLLRETKVGIAVNKLRAHPDKKVSELVKVIIKSWKDQVSAQKALQNKAKSHSTSPGAAAGPDNSHSTNNVSTNGTSEANDSTSNTNISSSKSPEKSGVNNVPKFTTHGKPRTAKNDGVRTDFYDDKVRNSCVDVTYTALAVDSEAPPSDILSCAKAIETVVFENEKGTSPSYRTKMRSLYMNLKDKNNPNLRIRVVNGEISADRLAEMTPQEMASEELKQEIQKLEKKNLFNAQGAKEQRAVTDRFTCGKCKQKKVSYYQMQTRSADEPLTTFCTCENCGNRWKFS